ncbi:hypothetical protein, partial [Pseudomonas aeruginosa]|uniref:hypothetical protein n=1 Tax=Pseudomonas aeruginosa TaxID=287 RepID=UPI001C378016
RAEQFHTAQRREESPWGSFGWWGAGWLPGYPGKELKHGKLHDDSWSGLFPYSREEEQQKILTSSSWYFLWQSATSGACFFGFLFIVFSLKHLNAA